MTWGSGDEMQKKVGPVKAAKKPAKTVVKSSVAAKVETGRAIRDCDRASFVDAIIGIMAMHMHAQLHNGFTDDEIDKSMSEDLAYLAVSLAGGPEAVSRKSN